MLNKVMIIGRLGRDVDLKYSQSGAAVGNLSIATDESYVDKNGNKVDRTEWHRVVVYQNTAENCAKYLSKGSLVYVEGSLQTRKWQDQQGQERYTTEIKAQRVQFLDSKNRENGNNENSVGNDENRSRWGSMYDTGNRSNTSTGNGPFPSEASGRDDVPF